MKLTDEHISIIEQTIASSSIESKEMRDDLIDHFCCAVEIYMKKGSSFENAFARAQNDISPNGLHEIQRETVFLLNANKIKIMRSIISGTGLLFSMTMSLGFLFKIMHWPGANMLLISGTLGLGLIFLPLLTTYHYRQKAHQLMSEKMKTLLGLISGVLFSLSVLFKQFHLMGAEMLFVSSMVIFTFGFLPFLFFRMYKKTAIE